MLDKYFKIKKAENLHFFNGKIVDSLDIGSVLNLKKFYIETQEVVTKYHNSLNSGRFDFCGTETKEDFVELLNFGDTEMIKNLKSCTDLELKRLNREYRTTTIEYIFDNEGDFFDVGTVLSGEPEAWLKEIKVDKENKIVVLDIIGTFSSNIKKETILHNASLILAHCKFFEERKIQCKIVVHFLSNGEHNTKGGKRDTAKTYNYFIVAKDVNQKIDYCKLSAILHPSFLRRGMFRIKEIRWNASQHDGYGIPCSTSYVTRLDSESTVREIEKKYFTKRD